MAGTHSRLIDPLGRLRAAMVLLGLLAALAVGADVYAFTGLSSREQQRQHSTVSLNARQVVMSFFAAWNADDPRGLCSLYSQGLLEQLGGSIGRCAARYGRLAPVRFQITSLEHREGTIVVGVIARHHGGSLYLVRERGRYTIDGISG